MLELNKNSFSVKLYKFFYGIYNDYDLPDNLCPFFWKMVIAFVFVIPLSILSIPKFIFQKINGEVNRDDLGWSALIGVIVYLAILFTFGIGYWISYFIFDYMFVSEVLHRLSILFGAFGITLTVAYIFNSTFNAIRDNEAPTFVKMTGEFAKAKYNKYCPTISWK